MDNGIHFISGLPRSGSTLLSGLLRQNPQLHAHISSPVSGVVGAIQQSLSGRSEYHPLVSDVQRRTMMSAVFDTYYAGVHETKLVVDTNRSWTGRLHLLSSLFPEAKVICCVRPLAWVVDSFERLVRESPLEPSKIYNFSPGGNVYTRCDHLNTPKGVIGSAYNNLKDGFYGPLASSLLIVPYDVLTRAPGYAMGEIYDFLGLEAFEHDFENVSIDADEFDKNLGARGLHTVRRRVEPSTRAMSLPPDLVARFSSSQFWGDPNRNPRNVRVLRLKPVEGAAPPPTGGPQGTAAA